MNRPLVVSAFGGLVLVMWLAAWSVVGSAERSQMGAEQPAGSQSVGGAGGALWEDIKKSLP